MIQIMKNTKLWLAVAYVATGVFPQIVYADHPAISFGSEVSGPVNTIPVIQLPKGDWSLGVRTEQIEFDAFSDTALEDFSAAGLEGVHSVDSITSTSLGVAVGVSDDLTVSLRIPYIQRENIREGELELGVAEAHLHGDSEGLGDATLLGTYRFSDTDDTDFAVLLGVKADTGKTDERDIDGVLFEAEFQPGSGSTDVLLGAAVTTEVSSLGIHANVLYSFAGDGVDDTNQGDAFFYNIAGSYRLSEDGHEGDGHAHQHLTWDAYLELNGEWRDHINVAGVDEENSGGTRIYLAPGVRLSFIGGWGGFLSLGVPVIENQNGKQTDVDYRLVAGFGVGF